MELIKPSEISARILTLLDESTERVIIVSPYIKISKWYKLVSKIKGLQSRRIILDIYVRDGPDNADTYRDLDQLDLKYKRIPHLHSKLYLNERMGIASSMNLLLSSEINSLEIGYATETWTEYNELLDYYHRYILIGEQSQPDTIAGRPATGLKEIIHGIREELNSKAKTLWFWHKENVLHISTTRSSFDVSIKGACLRISTLLRIANATTKESNQHSSLILSKVEGLTGMRVKILHGNRPEIIQLSTQAKHKLESTCINGILEAEAGYVVDSITRFINATDDLII